jgi:hypothetical protein
MVNSTPQAWIKQAEGQIPLYLPSTTAGTDFHPCKAAQFVASGINEDPKFAYANVDTDGVPMYVENTVANVAACARRDTENCRDLYMADKRPVNITIVLEQNNMMFELQTIKQIKPTATKLLWIADSTGTALYDEIRGAMKHIRENFDPAEDTHDILSVTLAVEDMHFVSSQQQMLDVIASYQDKDEYFLYIATIANGAQCSLNLPSVLELALNVP